MDSRTDNLAVTEGANVYEAIPIDLRKEQITESYKETMSKSLFYRKHKIGRASCFR